MFLSLKYIVDEFSKLAPSLFKNVNLRFTPYVFVAADLSHFTIKFIVLSPFAETVPILLEGPSTAMVKGLSAASTTKEI